MIRRTITIAVLGALALSGCANSTQTVLNGFKGVDKPIVYLADTIPPRDRIYMKKTLEYRGYEVRYGSAPKGSGCTTPVQRIALARTLGNASWNPRFGGDDCHNPDVRLEER